MVGIYKITNKLNNKAYIGQSVHCGKRFDEHCKGDQFIDEIIQLEGIENFNFEIVKQCNKNELNVWEDYYIMKYNTIFPNGYNKRWNCSEDLRNLLQRTSNSMIDDNKPWEKEEITDKELKKIQEWKENFSYKYSHEKNWIGEIEKYKKYKYNRRLNIQNRGTIVQLPKIHLTDKIFTQGELKHYNTLRHYIDMYNTGKCLWRMEYDGKWITITDENDEIQDEYCPCECGVYKIDYEEAPYKIEFKDRKIILQVEKIKKNTKIFEMFAKLLTNERINTDHFKFYNENQQLYTQEILENRMKNVKRIEIIE